MRNAKLLTVFGAARWQPSSLGAALVGFIDFENNVGQSPATIGSPIDSIIDSVSGASFTAATTARPTLVISAVTGRQVASFDGTANAMTFAGIPTGWPIGANAIDVISACNCTADQPDTGLRSLLSFGGASIPLRWMLQRQGTGGFNRVGFRVGDGVGSTSAALTSLNFLGAHAIRGSANGTTAFAGADGTDQAPAAVVPGITGVRSRIGADTAGTAGTFWQGEISAIIVVNRPLSSGEAAKAYAWGAARLRP